MKKAVIAIVVIIIIVLLALWYRGGMNQTAMATDASFEDEAAAILAQPISAQQKLDNLNANLQARMAARNARATKSGAASRVIPGVTTTTK